MLLCWCCGIGVVVLVSWYWCRCIGVVGSILLGEILCSFGGVAGICDGLFNGNSEGMRCSGD